jgi:quercetin dioxygenase-like cupin family protein
VEPGAEMAVLSGDLTSPSESYVVRFRTQREIVVPPHWHPRDEHITVLTGPFEIGMGKRFDASALYLLESGGYVCVPAEAAHFARYAQGTVIQVHGEGPFEINYVVPE